MNEITKSASKLVLLYIVAILGFLALFAGLWDVVHGQFSEVSKIILALFGGAVNFLFGFYFGSKGDSTQPMSGK